VVLADLTFGQTLAVAVVTSGVVSAVVSGGINLLSDTLNRRHERNTRARAERKRSMPASCVLSVNIAAAWPRQSSGEGQRQEALRRLAGAPLASRPARAPSPAVGYTANPAASGRTATTR
jgi:hypothetical protein